MSAIVTIRFAGDPAQFDKVVAANPDRLMRILADAKKHGALHHRFVGGKGEFMVIDEWPSLDAFQAFFSQQQEIPGLMNDAGVTAEPEVRFWEPMDTPDQL